jgi:drug/metabolite transporter (DMT)-like permease
MKSLRLAYVWMLLGAASFSIMSFLTHLLSDALCWQAIAMIRAGIALVLTVGIAQATGVKLAVFRPRTLWIRSTAGSVALLANFYSMTHYPISEVLALSNMFPLWVAVLSWPVLGERLTLGVWLAAACGVIGVFVLVQQPGETERAATSILPVFTALLASLASAVAMLGLHRLKGIDPSTVVAHFSGVSLTASMFAFLLLPRMAMSAPVSNQTLVVLIVLGMSATAGQIFLTKAFAAGPPAQVSVVSLTQVGFTMLLEAAFESRAFSTTTLLGLALIVAPTAWVIVRGRRGVKAEPSVYAAPDEQL